MTRFLDLQGARRYYDRFGSWQDSQSFYEDPPVRDLVAAADFARAQAVCEFGCGTGRLAETLLDGPLPPTARYVACDVSTTMIGLARDRLARFGDRVTLWQSGAEPDLSPGHPPFDRVLAAYVFDLLAPEAIRAALDEMHRCLAPGGLLCTVGLTQGRGLSALVSGTWAAVHRLSPALVGGCRPLELGGFLDPGRWRVERDARVVAWGVPSEVLVAARV